MQRIFNISYIHRVSFLYVFLYIFEDYCERHYYTDFIHRVCLCYVFFYALDKGFITLIALINFSPMCVLLFGEDADIKRLYHTDCIHRVSFQCVFFTFDDRIV